MADTGLDPAMRRDLLHHAAGVAHMIERAERFARSLRKAVDDAARP